MKTSRAWKCFRIKYKINWFVNNVNKRTLKLRLKDNRKIKEKLISPDLFDEKMKNLLGGCSILGCKIW